MAPFVTAASESFTLNSGSSTLEGLYFQCRITRSMSMAPKTFSSKETTPGVGFALDPSDGSPKPSDVRHSIINFVPDIWPKNDPTAVNDLRDGHLWSTIP
jgi:hypothetical protein